MTEQHGLWIETEADQYITEVDKQTILAASQKLHELALSLAPLMSVNPDRAYILIINSILNVAVTWLANLDDKISESFLKELPKVLEQFKHTLEQEHIKHCEGIQ